MIPEFNIKRIDQKVSNDPLVHVNTAIYVLTIIAYYVLTKGIHHQIHSSDLIGFAIGVGLITIQAVSRFLPVTKDWDTFNSGGLGALIVYNLAISILLIWFVPIFSPFVLILPPVLFITIYYRGHGAFLVSVVTVVALVVISTIKDGVPTVSYGYLYPYFTAILVIALGGIFERAGSVDEGIRQQFQKISQNVVLEREQLSSLINSMSDSVIAADKTGKILFHNRSSLGLLDQPTSLIDKQFSNVVAIYDNSSQPVDLFALARKSNHTLEISDMHLLSKNGEKIDLYINVTSINLGINKEGEGGFIVQLRDITKQKTLDEERSEFISITSHELRTPIATAEASLSILMNPKMITDLKDDDKKMIEKAHESVMSLADLINDLTVFASAEKQRLETKIERLDIVGLLAKITQTYNDRATAAGLQLITDFSLSLRPIVSSADYIREIVQILIDNALKYTEQGSVTVSANLDSQGNLEIRVKDTGVGIGRADKTKIFSKYFRSEDYRTRRTRGTGLGLYIAKRLTEYLKGRIWFESELNKGSTFFVLIPTIRQTELQQAPADTVPAANAKSLEQKAAPA
ncbi:MAG TPA: ATP-binding protein [Candidatus Saccharimonadales bacterium]|nr:ATP-binding protein [Candidatus Saccharimonadales bacterium]